MTVQTNDALVLMERALASRDPLELALAGFLSAYKGRTFDKQRRVIKHYVDWCLQNDLSPLEAKRPHIELFVRWCETQPWSESYICQHFVGVRSFYKTCVRDDVLLRNPAEFVDAPKVHEEGQKRTFLTPLELPRSSRRPARRVLWSTLQPLCWACPACASPKCAACAWSR